MKFTLAAAVLAATAPVAALAADAADPAVSVPPMAYRSAFAGTPAGVEAGQDDWKNANAQVGQFPRGHADLLKWEERQGGAMPAPSRQEAAPAPASAAPPTGGHHH